MLLLKRCKNERIKIGRNVIVEVREILGDEVWLGIAAPRYIEIDREEIWDEKMRKKKSEGKT